MSHIVRFESHKHPCDLIYIRFKVAPYLPLPCTQIYMSKILVGGGEFVTSHGEPSFGFPYCTRSHCCVSDGCHCYNHNIKIISYSRDARARRRFFVFSVCFLPFLQDLFHSFIICLLIQELIILI